MTYWAINAVFLAVAILVAIAASLLVRRAARVAVRWQSLGIALVVVLAMTAVFDNVMIGVGLVGYDESRISGWFIGVAPLEDFAYAIAAVILLPSLWIILGPRMPVPQHSAAGGHAASAPPRRSSPPSSSGSSSSPSPGSSPGSSSSSSSPPSPSPSPSPSES